MKQISIYKLTFSDDGTTYYFKGIDDVREFAESRIEDGWETDCTIEDLKDEDKVIQFITEDYGETLEIIFTITEEDFNNLKK
jgi:hypothetical protein